MHTIFVCPALATQIEGFDAHTYSLGQHVRVRCRDRYVALAIEAVTYNGSVRKIILRPLATSEALCSMASPTMPLGAQSPSEDWVAGFCAAIEGAEGLVSWNPSPSSR